MILLQTYLGTGKLTDYILEVNRIQIKEFL